MRWKLRSKQLRSFDIVPGTYYLIADARRWVTARDFLIVLEAKTATSKNKTSKGNLLFPLSLLHPIIIFTHPPHCRPKRGLLPKKQLEAWGSYCAVHVFFGHGKKKKNKRSQWVCPSVLRNLRLCFFFFSGSLTHFSAYVRELTPKCVRKEESLKRMTKLRDKCFSFFALVIFFPAEKEVKCCGKKTT